VAEYTFNPLVAGYASVGTGGGSEPFNDPRTQTNREVQHMLPAGVQGGGVMPNTNGTQRTELPVAAFVLVALAYLAILRLNGFRALIAVK
jgi:hypothetical protein